MSFSLYRHNVIHTTPHWCESTGEMTLVSFSPTHRKPRFKSSTLWSTVYSLYLRGLKWKWNSNSCSLICSRYFKGSPLIEEFTFPHIAYTQHDLYSSSITFPLSAYRKYIPWWDTLGLVVHRAEEGNKVESSQCCWSNWMCMLLTWGQPCW